MTIDDYQKESRRTAMYLEKVQEMNPSKEEFYDLVELGYISSGLGETGEVQGKIKKIIRDKGGKFTQEDAREIMKEVGDVIWYLARIADFFDFSLQEAIEYNIEKLFSRKERGVLGGSGDNR